MKPRRNPSSRRTATGQCRANTCELLEHRRLLCGLPVPHDGLDIAPQYQPPAAEGGPATGGIVWANRGTTDNFNTTYGGQANAARSVVDAALAFWNRTIINFNQDGGNDQIDITITAMARGTGWGGNGGVDTLIGNKPRTSSINLGGGGDTNDPGTTVEDAEGYYIDPTPMDYSEFQGGIINAWTGLATNGSAADNRNDLFSLVSIEIQHALGIDDRFTNLAWRQDPNDYLRPAGTSHATAQNDTADTPGKLYYLNGPGIRALFTSNNGGTGGEDRGYAVHTARPGQSYTVDGFTYQGQLDTGTTGYLTGARYLPSYVGVQALGVMYGYTVNPPQDVNGCFYAVPEPAIQRIHVRNPSLVSADRMEMRSTGGGVYITLDIGDDVVGTNMDGPFVCQFDRASYTTVLMEGGGGNDILRTDGNNGVLVTMRGGNGDDALDIMFIQKNLDLLSAGVSIEGGNNNDTIFVYDDLMTRNGETYTFNSSVLGRVGIAGGVFYDGTVEGIIMWTGPGVGTTNISSINAGQALYLNNVGGNDTVNIGSVAGLSNVAGYVQIENNPAFTTLNINDSGSSVPRNATIDQGANNFGFLAGMCPGTIAWDNADIQQITVTTGNQTDSLAVLRCSERLFIKSAGGFDNYTVGNNVTGLSQITTAVDVGPSPNIGVVPDSITIDDRGSAIGRSYGITPLGSGEFSFTGLPFALRATDPLFLFFKGGNGDDTLTLNGFGRYVDFDGGNGSDTFFVDDRTSTLALATATISTDRFLRITGDVIPQSITTRYTNVELPGFFLRDSCTSVGITGTPASIGAGQMSVFTGPNSDSITINPVDAGGNLTINGTLFINADGGSDTLNISAVGTTRDVAYQITHLSGPGILHVGGLGAAVLGETLIENVVFNAGDGNDTFAVEKLTGGAGVQINGGGGDDTCTIGNGDMSANLTSASSFGFNGQAGTGDTFVISNVATTTSWDYRFNTGSALSQRVSTGYFWTSSLPGVEKQIVNAGSARDSFVLDSAAAGVYSEFNGFAGNDGLLLGLTGNTLEGIRGPVVYNGGQDGGNMGVYDSADTTGDIVHLDANTLGAYAGNTLFGPGGSLTFTNLVDFSGFPAMYLDLGSGADTVYAQPLANGRITINGNNPAAAPGDTLNLATAGLLSPVVNGNAASGSLTSGNRQTLTWTGFEGSIGSDAVAPAVVQADINVNGIPGFADGGGSRQSIEVRFSENVAGRLSPSWLQLTNDSTGQAIPTSAIAVDYLAASNTARFTVPGLPNGVLPDGNYSGKVLAGLPDFFGNALPADAPFSFFFLNGDANRDRIVNIGDFAILASRFNQPGTFVQGDFNYNGNVEIGDFSILASKFNTSLPAARLGATGDSFPGISREGYGSAGPLKPQVAARFSHRLVAELLE